MADQLLWTPLFGHNAGTKNRFPKLAEAFGAKGYSASTPTEFEDVFKKALKEKGPVWIDCAIAREERVLPMIPGGGTVEDMIIG